MKQSPPLRQPPTRVSLRLPRARVLAGFLGVPVIFFVFLHGAMGLYQIALELPTNAVPLPDFDLDGEERVPAWYSTLLLALCALLLGLISAIKQAARAPFRRYWQALCGLFLFLSLDENVSLHERLIEPVRSALGVGGVFYHAWVIPVGIAVLLLAVVYLQFFLHLPRRTQQHFAVAAILYFGGAMGMEMLGGYFFETYGPGIRTGLAIMFEEGMEMSGAVFFFYSLLVYLQSLGEELVIEFPAYP